jgi:hypothetical protein
MDGSLTGLGGAFYNYVYEMPIVNRPGYCINHWEAINILFALCTFSQFIRGNYVTIFILTTKQL